MAPVSRSAMNGLLKVNNMRYPVMLILFLYTSLVQAETVSLNFSKAPVVSFLEATYRHMLHRDYILDPRLVDDGRKVTINIK